MPLFFGGIGILLIVAGLRDRIVNGNPSLVSLLKDDFSLSNPNNFLIWSFAIIFIGALGYIPKMRTVSRMFLVLVVIVIFVKNKQLQNVFEQVTKLFSQYTSGTSQVSVAQNPNSPIGLSPSTVIGNVINPPGY